MKSVWTEHAACHARDATLQCWLVRYAIAVNYELLYVLQVHLMSHSLLFSAPLGPSAAALQLLLSSLPAISGCSWPSGISALLTRATCGTSNAAESNAALVLPEDFGA
jgi:hypothetical protein